MWQRIKRSEYFKARFFLVGIAIKRIGGSIDKKEKINNNKKEILNTTKIKKTNESYFQKHVCQKH